ncbi:MAG: hypothetical protein ACRDK2_15110 [Solirubrobacteraceae bacterium]
MFHVELRQFPNNFCRFNLTEEQLDRIIVGPWTRGELIELGERKWNPAQAKLTVLDGPEIPLSQLTMGRGWRNAQRQSHEVTERVLAAALEAKAGQPSAGDIDLRLASDSLALALLSDLADGQRAPLVLAWQLACARYPDSLPSQSLALAEGALTSLSRADLIAIFKSEGEELVRLRDEREIQASLRSLASWGGHPQAHGVWIARS